jgi:hypothetical protein
MQITWTRQTPWLMYQPDTCQLHETDLDDFQTMTTEYYRASVGGSQSVRRMVGVDDDGQLVPLPGYSHTNWGSTALWNGVGTIQMTRALGDALLKTTVGIGARPDVTVAPLTSTTSLSVMSDGVGDAVWFHQFDPRKDAAILLEDVTGGGDSRLWDDCALVCMTIVIQTS